MQTIKLNFEVDRVRNLINTFGWSIVKQKVTEEEIELTIEKKVTMPAPDEKATT